MWSHVFADYFVPKIDLVALFVNHKIRLINRKTEVPHEGGMCDLLWSDPDGRKCPPLKRHHIVWCQGVGGNVSLG